MILAMKQRMESFRQSVISKFAKIVFRVSETFSYLRARFAGGKKRWAKFIEWVRSQKMNLDKFALRWNLRWYKYFFGNCIIAITATSFGFVLGCLLTIMVYDDGLERVTDLYNYFKNPPRR
jgi:hypothetical protein